MGRLSMEQLVNELIEADVGRVLVNEPLARYTTMKIGGPADILIVPKHVAGIENITVSKAIQNEVDCNWSRFKPSCI